MLWMLLVAIGLCCCFFFSCWAACKTNRPAWTRAMAVTGSAAIVLSWIPLMSGG